MFYIFTFTVIYIWEYYFRLLSVIIVFKLMENVF
jgi:hypothetical protein